MDMQREYDLVSEQIDALKDRTAWSKTPEGIQINAEVAQLRKTHGPALKYLEDAAYFTGHMDGRKGTIPRTVKCAPVTADGVKKTVSVTSSADSSPAVLAERARKLQEDREKTGKPISNSEAVRIIYQEAGLSLE